MIAGLLVEGVMGAVVVSISIRLSCMFFLARMMNIKCHKGQSFSFCILFVRCEEQASSRWYVLIIDMEVVYMEIWQLVFRVKSIVMIAVQLARSGDCHCVIWAEKEMVWLIVQVKLVLVCVVFG